MSLTLKYVGPKALCTVSGIGFDNSKEDKFVYISFLAELIQTLDHDYLNYNRYVVETGRKPLDEKTVLDIIRAHASDLDEIAEYWIEKTAQEVDEDIRRAQDNRLLSSDEKETLINNLSILRPYKIQRSMNKSIYYAGVKVLASIIQRSGIEYIVTQMYPKFLHVLHSVQGALRALHPPMESNIDIFEDQGHLSVQLKIGSR